MRMRRFAALCGAGAMALLLSACGGGQYRPVRDVPVKIGPPYVVRGVTYTPAADPGYDMLGYASWYGSESGNRTANGERFRPGWVTAAHTSLPLPSYIEVTALDTGRTIVVRVNDRGPFSGRGRVIDLSRGAAEQLGVRAQGACAGAGAAGRSARKGSRPAAQGQGGTGAPLRARSYPAQIARAVARGGAVSGGKRRSRHLPA